jgi:methionyl-tRNA synthetase
VKRTYYVTTPIYYANAEPHIGHTYTNILADTLVRWHRLCGADTFSVSGTDEHGEKMVEAAAKLGVTPAAFTERISALHQRTFAELGIAADRFVRTTDAAHARNVQAVLQRVYDAGWIELREYEGLYCVGCERFLAERDLVDGKCADHDRAPEPRRETNYFFLMSREFDWLRHRIETHPDFVRPERYRNEALAMLRDASGLGDLSISRPKARLDWGIELPFDRDHVCYVWFDALISYLTGAGYDGTRAEQDPGFLARWGTEGAPNAEHLIGKDILKPHAIFWPIMLKAMGLPPYRHLSVHGYWNVDERKVSKSLGNMIDPLAMRERYGFEAFRYFLLREMSFGLDAGFSEDALVARVNADLANNLGNLVSRTLNLVEKFFEGRIPQADAAERDPDAGVVALAETTHVEVGECMERLEPHRALERLVALSDALNRHVDHRAPWKAMKEGRRAHAATTLHDTCAGLRILAVLLAPFLPGTAQEIAARLGLPHLVESARIPADVTRAGVLPPGLRVERGAPLFPRLEPPAAVP